MKQTLVRYDGCCLIFQMVAIETELIEYSVKESDALKHLTTVSIAKREMELVDV